ncbi:hypothetical protein GE09DRAFT_1148808 [Coniochaeta sp. 2T2.1]|nr:hypothetical protein GE09DRAFT_1148808 [Coniochaeta sp. 2T2.1]
MDSPSATSATPRFPSYETLFNAASRGEVPKSGFPIASVSLRRLRWSFDGPLETAISVMADRWISPDLPPDEPYYQPATSSDDTAGSGSGNSSGSWHPISQDPAMEPKLSSISVEVSELRDWEDNWLDAHEGHYCPDCADEGLEPADLDPTQTRIGRLPGANPDDPDGGWGGGVVFDDDGTVLGHLLMCCGVERPRNTQSRSRFLVEATGESGFLTVHDYVEQVHRRLKGWREEILEATLVARECAGEAPFSGEDRLMVSAYGRAVRVIDEREWADMHREPY